MRPFQRRHDGIELRIPEPLAGWLSDLPELLESVGDREDDPAAGRLNVPVYLDDPEANTEWWDWMGGELDAGRAADRSAFRELVEAAPDGVVASEEEAHAFLRVLVEGRLVLAARLGVEVEGDYDDLPEEQAAALQALAELQVLLLHELGP